MMKLFFSEIEAKYIMSNKYWTKVNCRGLLTISVFWHFFISNIELLEISQFSLCF